MGNTEDIKEEITVEACECCCSGKHKSRDDKEYKDFSNKDYSYTNHYDVYGEIVSMRQHCLVLIVTCIVISAILSLIYLLLGKKLK